MFWIIADPGICILTLPYLAKWRNTNHIFSFFFFRRWVRLLFGREFPLQDLLVVWDALFADSITLNLVDYIFVAMLLYIRDACKYQVSYTLLKRMQTYFSKEKEDLRNAKFHCEFFNILKILPNAMRGAIYYQTRSGVFMKQIVSWS